MSTAPPANLAPEIVVLLFIVLLIVRRTVRQVQGAPVSAVRMFGFAAFYVLLFVALAFGTLSAAVGAWGSDAYGLLALYVAVPAAAGVLAVPYVERVVRFEERGDGQWFRTLRRRNLLPTPAAALGRSARGARGGRSVVRGEPRAAARARGRRLSGPSRTSRAHGELGPSDEPTAPGRLSRAVRV